MSYKLIEAQEKQMLTYPETGMGYQIISANKPGSYIREQYIVLNSEIVIEMDDYTSGNIRNVIDGGSEAIKASAGIIALNAIAVLNEKQFRNLVGEPANEDEKGAIDNPIENTDGVEVFVRLSAFNNDRRIDKVNKCLLTGSFTTTMIDYLDCKATLDDPVERYALPGNYKIQHAFHIKPVKTDTLQRGTVQAANGKKGGGKEAYFDKGTALRTFFLQTPY